MSVATRDSDTLRLIIIHVLPKPVVEHVQAIRTPICRRYRDSWALDYPPHITLRTGAEVPKSQVPEFVTTFEELLHGCKPFAIETLTARLDSMTYEGQTKSFLYLPVIKSAPLVQLNRHLLSCKEYRKSDRTAFDPHVTLFWGDLSRDEHQSLGCDLVNHPERFGESYRWQCDTVAFYRNNGRKWVPFHVFQLL